MSVPAAAQGRWWEGRDGEVLVSEINRASDGGGTFAGCRVGRCRDCRNARSRSWVERLRRSGNPHSLRARSSPRLHITSQRTINETGWFNIGGRNGRRFRPRRGYRAGFGREGGEGRRVRPRRGEGREGRRRDRRRVL